MPTLLILKQAIHRKALLVLRFLRQAQNLQMPLQPQSL